MTRDLAAVPFAGSSRRGRPRAVCSLSAAGTELRRRVLHARNVARPRVDLRGRGDGRAGHGGTDFGTRRGAGIGGAPPVGTAVPARIRAFDALHLRTRIGAVHFRPVQRAVARCRGRILPPEIAPLAGLGAGAETLLQRRDVIRHAPTMPGIVLPDDRCPVLTSPGRLTTPERFTKTLVTFTTVTWRARQSQELKKNPAPTMMPGPQENPAAYPGYA